MLKASTSIGFNLKPPKQIWSLYIGPTGQLWIWCLPYKRKKSQKIKVWQFKLCFVCSVRFLFGNIGGKRLGSVWFLAPFKFCSIRNDKISVNAAKSGKSDTDNQSDKGVGRETRQLWAIAKTAILTKLRWHFGGGEKKAGSDNSLVALCVI